MAITQAQLDAGKALVLDRLFKRYPPCREYAIRITVEAIKAGNPTQQQVGKKLLQQAYQSIFTADPVGRHDYRHWLADCLQAEDDETPGLAMADAVDAETIEVVP